MAVRRAESSQGGCRLHSFSAFAWRGNVAGLQEVWLLGCPRSRSRASSPGQGQLPVACQTCVGLQHIAQHQEAPHEADSQCRRNVLYLCSSLVAPSFDDSLGLSIICLLPVRIICETACGMEHLRLIAQRAGVFKETRFFITGLGSSRARAR